MKLTKADISTIMKAMGRRGGKKRAANLTPERRKEIAAMGGKAANAKKK